MSEKENIRKELQSLAPNLGKLKDDNPFATPQGYFDQLSEAVQQKISAREHRNEKQVIPGFSKLPRFALVGITSVLLMVAGYFFLLKEPVNRLNGLADEGFYEDYMAWYADYHPDAYYELILDGEPGFQADDQTIENDQIIDYLLDYGYYYMESPEDITD